MNPAPVNEKMYLGDGGGPKLIQGIAAKVTMAPVWVTWFTLVYRILAGKLVSAVKAATAVTASYLDFATELSAKNVNIVTLTPSPAQSILTLDLGAVTAGQRWYVDGHYNSSKGGTAGANAIGLDKSSGTATIQFMHDLSNVEASAHAIASATPNRCIEKIMKVTGSGTLVLKLVGYSNGSNSTIAAGDGQIYAVRMK